MSRLFVAFLVALAAVALQAQDEPNVQTRANLVRLDVYATFDGKTIEDLTSEEVDVLEDGVPQKVESFEHVRIPPTGTPPSGDASRARVVVIFLDTLHTAIEGSTNLRVPLVRFIDRLVGPDDLVALLTPEMESGPITLGRKAIAISNIMQADWAWGRRGSLSERDQKDRLYDACYGPGRSNQTGVAAEMKARRREKLTLDALAGLMPRLSGVRQERKAVLLVSDGWKLFRSDPELARGDRTREKPRDVLRRPPTPVPTDTGSPTGVNRVECEADRVALSRLDHTQRLREITDEANRGNVTFYPLYPNNLVSPDAVGGGSGADSLRFLADNTDGTALITANDIDSGLQRIVDDLSSYYLIGYSSTNTKLDGRVRSITVRVKRPGARARTRRGYRGRTADELISGTAGTPSASEGPDTSSSALTPVTAFNNRTQFRIRASSWARQAAADEATGGFWVVGEIDYRTRRELAWTAGAKAEVMVLASDGKEIASRTLDIHTEDGPFGFQVPESGGLPAGEYAVRVRVTADADSSLVLSDTARVVVGPGRALGEAVLWRRGPTTGPQHRRTADPRFQRSDRLRLELPTTASGAAAARLLDRNGALLNVPVQVAEREDADGFRWIVVDSTLAPLAPGDYAIEVTQGSAKQVTVFRIVP